MTIEQGGYEVGYCRPPKASRWQAGQSGNPSGRRRKEKTPAPVDLSDALVAALREHRPVKIGGKTQSMPAFEIAARALVHDFPGAGLREKIMAVRCFKELGVLERLRELVDTEPEEEAPLFTEVDRRFLDIVNKAIEAGNI